jgi:hypothetical protein
MEDTSEKTLGTGSEEEANSPPGTTIRPGVDAVEEAADKPRRGPPPGSGTESTLNRRRGTWPGILVKSFDAEKRKPIIDPHSRLSGVGDLRLALERPKTTLATGC